MEYTEQDLELRGQFDKFVEKNGKEDLLARWDEKILSLNNPALSAYFALLNGEHAEEHAKLVLESDNLEAIFELSEKYPEHSDYFADINNFDYNFEIVKRLFDQGVKTVDGPFFSPKLVSFREKIAKHVKAMSYITETDKAKEFLEWYFNNYKKELFVWNSSYYEREKIGPHLLKGLSEYIDTIINNISNTCDADELLSLFFLLNNNKYGSELGFNYLRDAIIKTENARVNYYVLGYDSSEEYFKKHDDAIIKSNNLEYNYLTAKEKPKSNVQGHLDVILKSNNPEFLYNCLKDIPSTDQSQFLKAIYESGDVEYNYLACMLGLENDSLNKFLVIESKNLEYIFNLAERFPDDPFFDIYVKIIKDSGNEEYISKLHNLKVFMIEDIDDKIKLFEKKSIK